MGSNFVGLVKVLSELGWIVFGARQHWCLLCYLFLLIVAQKFGGGWVGSCLTKYIGLQKQSESHKMPEHSRKIMQISSPILHTRNGPEKVKLFATGYTEN